MYTTTFGEPRAWAMEWDGAALAAAAEPRPVSQAPAVTWRRMSVPPATSVSRNGAGVFSDPQAWALGWEGTGLSDALTWRAQPVRAAEEI